MNNLETLIQQLQVFCMNHTKIKRFRFDDYTELDSFAELDNEYYLVYVVPNDSFTISNNTGYFGTKMSLDIYVLDRLKEDRTNYLTIQNETNNILNDIIMFFKNSNISIINDDYLVQNVNDEFTHRLNGKMLNITFLVDAQTECVFFDLDCENGTITLKNSLGDTKDITVPPGQHVNYLITDSDFELIIKDNKGNILETHNFMIPAFSNQNDEVQLSVISKINIENSDNSYSVEIDDDFVLPDTGIKIEIKDENGMVMHELDYVLPSSTNHLRQFTINNSILNLDIVDGDNNLLEQRQFIISPESIVNDTIQLSVTSEIVVENSDDSYSVILDDDFVLPDTDIEIKLKNSEDNEIKTENYSKPSVGNYNEEIEIDDIVIDIYIENNYKDSITIIYPENI